MRDVLVNAVKAYALMKFGVLLFAALEPRDVPIDRIEAMGNGLLGLAVAAVMGLVLWTWGKARP